MNSLAESGIFKAVSAETLELIKTLNTTWQHTFLIPTRFISSEIGQVGFLLNEYFNWKRDKTQRQVYRSFFANSRFEALQGAIKIARQHGYERKTPHPGNVVICDPTLEIKHFIDPLGRGEKNALIPGIKIVATLDEVTQLLAQGKIPLTVVVCPGQERTAAAISGLLRRCQEQKIITIFEDVDLELTSTEPLIHSLTPRPDIIVTGESFTDYEIPCGTFSMLEHIHKPWASVWTCFLHTSTYAGNRLVLSKMRENLLQQVPFFASNPDIQQACAQIAAGDAERLNAFATYINPGLIKFYALMGLEVNPVKAHGSQLTLKTKEHTEKTLLDCVAGGGAVVRGHTPDDLVSEVIAVHDTQTDYWDALQKRFFELSGFSHAFPAISGATAVDIAMSLALLANKDKTQILTFKENYAGKTLLSLVGTAEEMWQEPFLPLYHDVNYVDPFAVDAGKQLSAILTSGRVALVWFEIIQGATEREIPRELLEIIMQYKEEFGYIVGVDEILMGFYRTGALFSHTDTPVMPDMITLAKALCDGTFPMGMTLVSAEVYQNALKNNPEAVRYYEKLYVNQSGSHIALHCINTLLAPGVEEHVKRVGEILQQGLLEISQNSPFIGEVAGKGLSQCLYYKPDNWLFELFWCYQSLTKADTFLYFNRFAPALTMTEEEARLLVENLKKVFYRGKFSTYAQFGLYLLKAIVSMLFS